MPEITVVGRDGAEHIIEREENVTLMEAIRDSGMGEILAICGGVCSCATCHVHVAPAFVDKLPKMSEDENAILESAIHRDAYSRLSCQVRLKADLNGLRVRIAAEE